MIASYWGLACQDCFEKTGSQTTCMKTTWRECAQSLSCVQLFATSWTVALQAPLSMEISRQGYWSVSPFPPPEDLPHPGTEPMSPASAASAGEFFAIEPPEKPQKMRGVCVLNHFSHVRLSVTLWTVDPQAALSMGFSRQEYWSG